jgi:flagellar hook-length control protein FliK
MKDAAEAAQAAAAKGDGAAGYAGIAAAALASSAAKDARALGAGASAAEAPATVGAPAGAALAGPPDPSQDPALNLLNAAAAAPAGNAVAPARFLVAASVGDPAFGAAVSHPIVTMARTGLQSAELTLNPEHFGPVSVSIQMTGREATVSISADHEATRTALREALPHLDALFAQSGLQLGGAHVGDGSERNAGRQAQPGEHPLPVFAPASAPAGVAAGAAPAAGAAVRGGTRLVDTFA